VGGSEVLQAWAEPGFCILVMIRKTERLGVSPLLNFQPICFLLERPWNRCGEYGRPGSKIRMVVVGVSMRVGRSHAHLRKRVNAGALIEHVSVCVDGPRLHPTSASAYTPPSSPRPTEQTSQRETSPPNALSPTHPARTVTTTPGATANG
jgi:hypothetical protein